MRPTTQKNNARPCKTIAIVAVIAVVAIALAAVASAFNGVKVVQRYNFDPVKYTFAPYLAYIQQIRETWIHSWSLARMCIRLSQPFPDETGYLQHVISQSPLTEPNCQAASHPP